MDGDATTDDLFRDLGATAVDGLDRGCDTRSHAVSELVEEVRHMSKT
jgi:hypothetical protein